MAYQLFQKREGTQVRLTTALGLLLEPQTEKRKKCLSVLDLNMKLGVVSLEPACLLSHCSRV